MREIEFRAIAYGSNKFVYGWLYQTKYESDKYVIRTFPNKDDDYADFIVHKNTIGQYTGLRDKYGVKIFEGDIVIDRNTYVATVIFLIQECGFCLSYRNSDTRLGHRNYGGGYEMCDLEVIGNIYENPELLAA